MIARKTADPSTPLVEYFANFIGEQPIRSRSRYTGAIKLFSAMLGRPAILSDLAGDADARLREYAKSRGFSWKTAEDRAYWLRALWKHAAECHDVAEWPVDNRQAPTLPDEWHNKPHGYKNKRCPVCGCPANVSGLHRSAPSGAERKWLKRKKSPKGWTEIEVGPRIVRRATRAPTGPTARVVKLIGQAATMQANGKTLKETADALGVKIPCISDWRVRFRDLWDKAFAAASEKVLLLVREIAGTQAALENPAESLARIAMAEKWAARIGEPLFPKGDKTTLADFYAEYYLPNCLADNSVKGLEGYSTVMRMWKMFTGDPPLEMITVATLAAFRDSISKLPGKSGIGYASPNSVRKHLRHLQAVLDKAGQPGRRNRDAAGLLDRVPWIKPPREIINPPKIVAVEDLSAIYVAAACMDKPRIEHVKAPAWWRLLLVLTYNTGFRRRTLLSLRMEHIDWRTNVLTIPAKFFKNRRGQIVPLNEVVMQHLRATRTDRELILPFPHDVQMLYTLFYRLQEMAAIPPARRFGLHAIRKTAATVLWGDSPQAAQLMMGHGQMDITRLRYVAGASILRLAADSMPQPEAFKGGEGSDPA